MAFAKFTSYTTGTPLEIYVAPAHVVAVYPQRNYSVIVTTAHGGDTSHRIKVTEEAPAIVAELERISKIG